MANLDYLSNLPAPQIDLPNLSNLSFGESYDNFQLNEFYENFSTSKVNFQQNLTALQDFEVFDSRDLMNVVCYSMMSLGQ